MWQENYTTMKKKQPIKTFITLTVTGVMLIIFAAVLHGIRLDYPDMSQVSDNLCRMGTIMSGGLGFVLVALNLLIYMNHNDPLINKED